MLERLPVDESKIISTLTSEYGMINPQLEFLPIGADTNSAVYRVKSHEDIFYVKLRRRDFNPASVMIPFLLQNQGKKMLSLRFLQEIIKNMFHSKSSLWQFILLWKEQMAFTSHFLTSNG